MTTPSRRDRANAVRFLAIDAVEAAKSGHPGMPMGMADIAEVLWNDYLQHNPKNPKWFNRDRFVLSGGHGSMLIYSLLHLTGYESVSMDEIKRFRQYGSAHLAATFNREDFPLVDNYIYAICSDGDLMEGVSYEAASIAGHLGLGN